VVKEIIVHRGLVLPHFVPNQKWARVNRNK
jgi:hypothetical protein